MGDKLAGTANLRALSPAGRADVTATGTADLGAEMFMGTAAGTANVAAVGNTVCAPGSANAEAAGAAKFGVDAFTGTAKPGAAKVVGTATSRACTTGTLPA